MDTYNAVKSTIKYSEYCKKIAQDDRTTHELCLRQTESANSHKQPVLLAWESVTHISPFLWGEQAVLMYEETLRVEYELRED